MAAIVHRFRSARSGRRLRSLRADAIDASISNQPGVSNFLPVGDTQALRVMPTVGLEYRYPFINVQPWGTTTIEPIAQVIIRPNETYAGKLPNEDAQSLVFDASNLFSVDKFSGYDRVEGGGRANVGVQATTQFDRGGTRQCAVRPILSAVRPELVRGRRRHQYRRSIPAWRTPRSDYVASVNYSPNRTYTFSTRARFDEATWNVSASRPKAAPVRSLVGQPAVRRLCRAAGPRISDPPRRHSGQRLGQGCSELGGTGAARWDLEANKINQYVDRRGLCRRLLRSGGQLRHLLYLLRGYDAAGAQSRFHAADRPADPRDSTPGSSGPTGMQ